MSFGILQEIERFEQLGQQKFLGPRGDITVEPLAEYAFVLRPAGSGAVGTAGDKDIALTLMGLTHGNEFAGAAILNEILSHIAAGTVPLAAPVAFIMGNPWAARENKRFLESDLNRSFARQQPTRREELRARALEPLLRRSAFLVDYHQTTRESDRAFFIFPYLPRGFAFARAIAPRLTVVTHWGKPFSAEGMCTDEYVNSHGGTGISLEVGQNSLDPYQIAVGVDAGLWAIRVAADAFRSKAEHGGASAGGGLLRAGRGAEIYTWAEIVAWPDQGLVDLVPNLHNFKDVALGDAIGTVGGRPIVVRHPGKVLFPKYLTHDQQLALASRPTELCRIMRRIDEAELPSVPGT